MQLSSQRTPEEIARWNPSIEDLAIWEPGPADFIYGRTLLAQEDYSRAVLHYGLNVSFSSLAYCILSTREQFNAHAKQFREYVEHMFNPLLSIDAANATLENEQRIRQSLEIRGFGKQKANAIMSAAKTWIERDFTVRLRDDAEEKKLGFEFRDEMIKYMTGVGPKLASLSLRMLGYHDQGVIDSWATLFCDAHGKERRFTKRGHTKRQYQEYEDFLRRFSDDANVSIGLYQGTIYAMCSSWIKDSGILRIG